MKNFILMIHSLVLLPFTRGWFTQDEIQAIRDQTDLNIGKVVKTQKNSDLDLDWENFRKN